MHTPIFKIYASAAILTLIVACSSSSDKEPDNIGMAESEFDLYLGTWISDCISSSTAEATRSVFIHTENSSTFVEEQYAGFAPCSSRISRFNSATGAIEFGQKVTESTFGSDAHQITFTDESDTSSFKSLVSVSENKLRLGDLMTIVGDDEWPSGIDSSIEYSYLSLTDSSYLESLEAQVSLTIDVEMLPDFDQLDSSALVLEVIADGQRVPTISTNPFYSATTSAVLDSTVSVEITWSENFNGQILKLASISQVVEIKYVYASARFDSNAFSYAFDADRDGISNIDERIIGTDPFRP